jgi:hypothetical protein
MRRAIRFLVVAVFAALVFLPVEPATAAPSGPGVLGGAVLAASQPTATPNPSAPAGVKLNPEQQQPPNKSKQKVVIGVIAALLLVIVYFGRTSRTKRRKKAQKATSG